MSTGDGGREALIAELGAYLDQELPADRARAVERRLFGEPEVLALLQELRADQAALRADLDRIVAAPPPDRLLEQIQAGFERRGAEEGSGAGAGRGADRGVGRGAGRAPWWSLAAASLAFLAIGAGSGLWWAESRLGQALERFEARSEVERGVIAATVSRALETRMSGEPVDWESGEVSGRVIPLRTYRSRSGHWCREYARTTRFREGPISVLALACRTDDGQWVTIRAEPRAGPMSGDEL